MFQIHVKYFGISSFHWLHTPIILNTLLNIPLFKIAITNIFHLIPLRIKPNI